MKWLLCFVFVAVIEQFESRTLQPDDLPTSVAGPTSDPSRQCADNAGFNESMPPNPFNFEFTDIRKINEDKRDYRKFATCIWVTLGVVTMDGTIDKTNFDTFLWEIYEGDPEDADPSYIDSCKNIFESNPEDTAVKLNRCFVNAMQVFTTIKWDKIAGTAPLVGFNPALECAESLDSSRPTMPNPFNAEAVVTIDEDDESYRDFVLCVWTKVGVVKRDGTINKRHFDSFLHKVFGGSSEELAFISTSMKPCKKTKGSNAERTAVKLNKCYLTVMDNLRFDRKDSISTTPTTTFNPARQCSHTLKLHQTVFPSPYNFDGDNIFDENDKAYREFILCLWTAAGVVKMDGAVNRRAFHAFLQGTFAEDPEKRDLLFKNMEPCKDVKENIAEQTAVKLNTCFLIAMDELKNATQETTTLMNVVEYLDENL